MPKGLLKLDEPHYAIDAKKPLCKLLAKSDVKPPQFLAAFRAGYAAAERAAGITPQEGANG